MSNTMQKTVAALTLIAGAVLILTTGAEAAERGHPGLDAEAALAGSLIASGLVAGSLVGLALVTPLARSTPAAPARVALRRD
ncbi:hypothetical protein GWI72_12525 [Microvirga tunisiensis]|uniref:Uncharacterized protein n=2 Tax=Pannonibacter tanglangensis TaxID=2750084 RepID=A0ABW9ZPB1_9HYPH|nr:MULTISPECIES: hypothetical protein [unclassified Pannonibacter]NBN64560.1 hypothetical protein [Pannonibacter sp. XCT-34]NBN79095.1 hypothetical protein [Pannonibacter sp. XCT-53]